MIREAIQLKKTVVLRQVVALKNLNQESDRHSRQPRAHAFVYVCVYVCVLTMLTRVHGHLQAYVPCIGVGRGGRAGGGRGGNIPFGPQ